MKKLYTDGITVFAMKTRRTNKKVVFSVISRRAANLSIRKSAEGQWESTVIPYSHAWPIHGNLCVVGFQPASGYHIAIKDERLP